MSKAKESSTVKFTITLPSVWQIESRGVTVNVTAADLNEDMVARGAFIGLSEKIRNAAASAGRADHWIESEAKLDNGEFGRGTENPAAQAATKRLMSECYARLCNGDWGAERESIIYPWGSDLTDYIAPIIRNIKIKGVPVNKMAAYKAAKTPNQKLAYLAVVYDALPDATCNKLEAKAVKARDDEGIDVDIDI